MLTATVSRLRGIEKFTETYVSELLEIPNSLGLAPLHVVIEMGHVATAKCLLREGVRLTTDTDNSTGRKALHSLAQSDVAGGTVRRLTDLLLSQPGMDAMLDVKDALDQALTAPAPELCAEDLRTAMRALGRVVGVVDVDDVLDRIFSAFCIGK